MKTFRTFDTFARHLERVVKNHQKYELKAAKFIGKVIVKQAKDSIGHLQEGAGPFSTWPELADSTKADKERLGFVFNEQYNPLLRTGELRDSIKSTVTQLGKYTKVRVGSTSEIMVYQELGTAHIPPRSVLGLTMYKSMPVIKYTTREMLFHWLENKQFTPKWGDI